MRRMAVYLAGICLVAAQAWAEEIRLPELFLYYDGGAGSQEIDAEETEEQEMEPYSQRHRVTLRIKEQWSDSLTTNLYSAISRKLYLRQNGSYTYFYLNPEYVWDVSDRLRWRSEFRYKRTWYDEPDAGGESKDLNSLLAETEITWKALERLKITPFLRGVFDLYENPEKVQQIYTAGLSFESKINPAVRLSGRYRAIAQVPLGDESTVSNRFNNEFGVNLSWDPNR
jgi:hypothetical protein